jgi:formamidopyrimidine-DNA glycosylase
MPELPEVEVVKRSLIRNAQDLIIKSVKINDGRLRYKVNKNEIKKIVGLKVIRITRRSKFILFFFNTDLIMLVHLGMTGKFFFISKKNKKHKTSFYYDIDEKKDKKHDRVIFYLSQNQKLVYNDVRKFGFIKLLCKSDIKQNLHLKNLGLEPLNKKFNYTYFKNYILGRNRSIKDILMDQKFISGLGNIYANEILFSSGVRPLRRIENLKSNEIKKIIKFTKKILIRAISLGGSSIKDFSSDNGKKGSFQQHFNVYGKKDQNCSNKNCNQKITKTVIANRASFYCPKCQK